jgi:hypothetical protein
LYLELKNEYIPGTILKRSDMGGVTGMEFLKKIFFITDGIMLAQIREISAVDGSTLQNWVKRGWVVNPVNKQYNIDCVARILIINMLRDTMQLGKISFLLRFINGDPACRDDDIIPESQLYDYICTVADIISGEKSANEVDLRNAILAVTEDFEERAPGDRRRLCAALEIILTSYYASIVKKKADDLLVRLESSGPSAIGYPDERRKIDTEKGR